jgi:hypothetical protein
MKVQGTPKIADNSAARVASIPKGESSALSYPTSGDSYVPAANVEPPSSYDDMNWTARLRFNQFEVDRSFTIFIFICKESEIPNDPSGWITNSYLAGCDDVFVNRKPQHCGNCQGNADLTIEDYVQLDDALLDSIESVQKDKVVPYLKENLHWRVAKVGVCVLSAAGHKFKIFATYFRLMALSSISRRLNWY